MKWFKWHRCAWCTFHGYNDKAQRNLLIRNIIRTSQGHDEICIYSYILESTVGKVVHVNPLSCKIMNLIYGYTYLQFFKKNPQYNNKSCFESKFMVLCIEMNVFTNLNFFSLQSENICHMYSSISGMQIDGSWKHRHYRSVAWSSV